MTATTGSYPTSVAQFREPTNSENGRAFAFHRIFKAVFYLNEVMAEDRLDRAHDGADRNSLVEADLIEFLDHFSRPECAERASFLRGWARGELTCGICKGCGEEKVAVR